MPSSLTQRLEQIAEQLRMGENPAEVSVRTLLSWFGAQRRGYWIVGEIRSRLKRTGLQTEPDFNSVWIDAPISFVLIPPATDEAQASETTSVDAAPLVGSGDAVQVPTADPAYRIGKLESANRPPVSVNPDASIQEAVTLMLSNDFSQLPVMQSERDLKGIISWGTIGKRLALGIKPAHVRDCMGEHPNVTSVDTSLFQAISGIVQNDYVLVRDHNNVFSGIVTTADLSQQFATLAEPFLLLGEIENHIRRMIDGRFSTDQLKSACDPADTERQIHSAADLTFGEYERLLERPENWQALSLKIDRAVFVKKLDQVREIRNDVMHFDPDGTPESDLTALRSFLSMMHELVLMGAL